jgi:hypothetical protein
MEERGEEVVGGGEGEGGERVTGIIFFRSWPEVKMVIHTQRGSQLKM